MPDPCAPIQQAIQSLRLQIQQIQSSPGYIQGPHDPHPGKPDPEMLNEVKKLWTQVEQKTKDYNACELSHGGKPDLMTTLSGSFTLTVSGKDVASVSQPVSLGMFFLKYQHTNFAITSFPVITIGPVSGDTITAKMTGGGQGTFDPITGLMNVSVTWHVQHSNTLAGDSDLTIVLSTESKMPAGSRLTSTGMATLAGTGVFSQGHLGGDIASLVISGTIAPLP